MASYMAHFALLVRDYDEAIQFYTRSLGFRLLEDTVLSETKRWVRVAPNGGTCAILLAKAANEQQLAQVGCQAGGRVFLFLNTDSFDSDHERLLEHNIRIVRGPIEETYGRVLVFEDLYGNLWDLIEPATAN
jgi:catechol 2,3-dioxygenase-like lactoylglutathione lyase family enzyme